MKMLKKISIIVPVYNVERYLNKCIESLVKQTYKNIEIILVDDGSTDNSGLICDEWSKKNNNIKVIHKCNKGIADTRNCGLDNSTGEYIVFVDSDDFVSLDFIEKLFNLLISYNADVAIGKSLNFLEGSLSLPKPKDSKTITKIMTSEDAIRNLLYEKDFATGTQTKIYKKKVFNNIRFPIGKKYEDLFTLYKVLNNADVIVFSNIYIYYYLVRKDSIIGSIDPKKCLDFLDASYDIFNFVSNNLPSIKHSAEYKLFVAAIELFVHYPLDKKSLDERDINNQKLLWNIIKKYRVMVLFNINSKFKYRILAFISFFGKKMVHYFFIKFAKR